ncbi:MAG: HAD family hydrolase [Dehalococcoidia bacterium]|jgi:putative hydrolase of the HAD superfamily|nr:HAD family hydrolase [Dehalococcoidia bacterium]
MSEPEVILFDLDDTIVDFTWNKVSAWRDACELASGRTGADTEALHASIEAIGRRYWADEARSERGRRDLRAAGAEIVATAFEELGVTASTELRRMVSDHYRDLRDGGIRLFPRAIEVLEELRGRGHRLGLVTNGSQQEQRGKIERFDLEGHFEHIQIEGEFGLGKPHDEAYRHALERMGAAAERTWFIGDNIEWDVSAPQRHGMFGVWVDAPGVGLPTGSSHAPDRVIRNIVELL